MRLIENKVYLELKEMVECGVSENYLLKTKSQGKVKCWHFIKDPSDNRKVLIGYEELRDIYKQMVKERFGDPYDMVARQPILDMVVQDAEALKFFRSYKYGSNKNLPIEIVNRYTRAASWLNMLSIVQDDRSIIKQQFKITVPDFYTHVGSLINQEKKNARSESYTGHIVMPLDFPATYQRLMAKVTSYKIAGYECLIDPMYGNKVAAKIGKTENGYDQQRADEQMAVIRKLAASNNNLDSAQVTLMANLFFEKQGWPTLSESRVYQIMNENKAVLTPGRLGSKNYMNGIAMQNRRFAPKFPTYYYTLDGWTVELLYQENGTYNNRLVLVVVLDAMNKYPVGYAIGDRENSELIKEANRNAILHLKELFGDYYTPYQLQSDRYSLKKLTPFYQAAAHLHTPAAVGNAKSKVIERYFLTLNKDYLQRLFPGNWSGFGLTSRKKNQVNIEALDLKKHAFPDRAGVVRQIEAVMEAERRKKLPEYLQKWEAMPTDHRQAIEYMSEDWLMVFGQPVGGTNRISGQGIIKTIAGVSYTYDSFEPAFRSNLTIDWTIVADEFDYSKVLAISPDGKLRFLLEEKMQIAMSARETTQEHLDYRKRIKDYNAERRQEIMNMYADDADTVRRLVQQTPLAVDSTDELAMKTMLTYNGVAKEAIQDAKGLKRVQGKEQKRIDKAEKTEAQDWDKVVNEYWAAKTDVNKYL